ncbi:hypothetical protein GOV12_02320 [Candidatus Pacearchaeota archaeon]|nr:hypothetical protein [Candidatus Pacearchaeota archaeon]
MKKKKQIGLRRIKRKHEGLHRIELNKQLNNPSWLGSDQDLDGTPDDWDCEPNNVSADSKILDWLKERAKKITSRKREKYTDYTQDKTLTQDELLDRFEKAKQQQEILQETGQKMSSQTKQNIMKKAGASIIAVASTLTKSRTVDGKSLKPSSSSRSSAVYDSRGVVIPKKRYRRVYNSRTGKTVRREYGINSSYIKARMKQGLTKEEVYREVYPNRFKGSQETQQETSYATTTPPIRRSSMPSIVRRMGRSLSNPELKQYQRQNDMMATSPSSYEESILSELQKVKMKHEQGREAVNRRLREQNALRILARETNLLKAHKNNFDSTIDFSGISSDNILKTPLMKTENLFLQNGRPTILDNTENINQLKQGNNILTDTPKLKW